MAIKLGDDALPPNMVKLNNAIYLVRTQAGYRKAIRDYFGPFSVGVGRRTIKGAFAYPAIVIISQLQIEFVPLSKWAEYWGEIGRKLMENDADCADIIRKKLEGY